ncbi:MAG: hypothetical protein AAF360_15060, partial [Pseudomonadota bacterium]
MPPELSALTNFTFLTGASHPEEMARRAAELGLTHIAIADVNSVAGVVRAHSALKDLARDGVVAVRTSDNVDYYDVVARAAALGRNRDPRDDSAALRAEKAAARVGAPSVHDIDGPTRPPPARSAAIPARGVAAAPEHPPEAPAGEEFSTPARQSRAADVAGRASPATAEIAVNLSAATAGTGEDGDEHGAQNGDDADAPLLLRSLPQLIPGARLRFLCGAEVTALPTDRAAWGRLTRLLTVGKRQAKKGACELTLDDLDEWGEGL